jgi:UDP-galactopyranose mutase
MDIVCFSHLRWDYVWQRPQHLLSRFARHGRVIFVEEALPHDDPARPAMIERTDPTPGVIVLRPRTQTGQTGWELERTISDLLAIEWARLQIHRPVVWFYTPMALPLALDLQPAATVYDCMDELSAFQGAPALLPLRERALLDRADLVFTGGPSLFEANRKRHPRTFCFPSSVDAVHFARARARQRDPLDQRAIARPRIGFFGVLDERFDRDLVAGIAEACPGWSLVMIGPVAKIRMEDLPALPNIHYLGMKRYDDLPSYIAGWDVALIPFARNEATRYISPTKVLEYMAAGKPIVSTSIADIVRPYGERGLARIADTPAAAVAAIRDAMTEDVNARLAAFDLYLTSTSWDQTYRRMRELIENSIARRSLPPARAN